MQNDKLSCLIIHGFDGGVYEIITLSDYLTDKNYIAVCTKLKGHTGCGKDMKGTNYKDWISSAEDDLTELMKTSQNIAIIGFSMGGLIAVNLAEKYDIKAIVTINTPIYYWNIHRVFSNLLDDLKSKELINFKRYINAKKASPMISMLNFLKLLKITKPKLINIECPFLVLQTKDDDTTKLKSAKYIYNNISSIDKEIILYDKGGHLVLISDYKQNAIVEIEAFLEKFKEE